MGEAKAWTSARQNVMLPSSCGMARKAQPSQRDTAGSTCIHPSIHGVRERSRGEVMQPALCHLTKGMLQRYAAIALIFKRLQQLQYYIQHPRLLLSAGVAD